MTVVPLLQRFIDDELERSGALIQRVIAGTVQLLGRTAEPGVSKGERLHQSETATLLNRESTTFEQAYSKSVREQVMAELEDPGEAGIEDGRHVRGRLQLLDESQVEVDVEILRAMQLIDSTAEWELRELQSFTSTLAGQTHVSANSNPFRPVVYATALWEAASAIALPHMQRATLVRTASGVIAGLLKSQWAAATSRLESQGVQPGMYRTVVLPSGSVPARRMPAEVVKRTGPSALMSSMPGLSESPTMTPVVSFERTTGFAEMGVDIVIGLGKPEFEEALLRLDHLLKQAPAADNAANQSARHDISARIEQQRYALVASAEGPSRQLVELICRLFDAMRADAQLAVALRPVVSRLQVPALRMALADPTLMETFEHPAWLLLDRIGNIGMCYPRAHDERLEALVALCDAFATEASAAAAPDVELFRHGLRRVETLLAAQLKTQRREAQESIDALEVAEQLAMIEQQMSRRLTDQLVPIRTSPVVRRFITGPWAKVIATHALRHGNQSDEVMEDLKTIDELLWSVDIPDHQQSRQKLSTLMPGLLARLQAGMEVIDLPPTDRKAIFDALAQMHSEGLRPGGDRPTAGALTPAEIVRRTREEVVAEPGHQFGDSVIDLSSMDTVPAEMLPSRWEGLEESSRRVEELRAGDRQRLFINGRWSHVQLLWRSDRGMFFSFAGERASRTHSITRQALERLSSAGLLQPNEVKPLVKRASDHVMRHLPARR